MEKKESEEENRGAPFKLGRKEKELPSILSIPTPSPFFLLNIQQCSPFSW
jgi:hypothetical protein